ncbi:putative sterigmatocystin biosynthesis monooxygenase [Venturia nashicola]|uniref:Putative sterigmatocystin biosynthesis monooxygenase n=1 Tax=Venturia nashicola TaxID=86259 RepID=A0A4Z1P310_9PEZI|nr:putative sterigmatocystin biosynthesis monooxygenase [Venturia nashicola]
MKYLLSFIPLIVFVACRSHGNLQQANSHGNLLQAKRQDDPCPCDTTAHSQCPSGRLDESSLCACLNNAELFCWYRNNRQCASPVPKPCPGLPPPPAPTDPTDPSEPKYTPPNGPGAGGLNCVEMGYCSEATKSKSSTTIMVNGTATVIDVPVGLPTGDTVADPFAPPAPVAHGISFAQLPRAGPVDPPPQMTPPPRMRVVRKSKRSDGEEAKAVESSWYGNGL